MTRPDDITAVVRAVEQQFNGADILINNAGAGSNETIMEAADELCTPPTMKMSLRGRSLKQSPLPLTRRLLWPMASQ